MTWIRNLCVACKLGLVIIVAVIGMIIMGYTAYTNLKSAGNDLEDMYVYHVEPIRMLGEEIDHMRVIQVRVMQAIADPKRIPELNQSMEKQIATYEKTWAEYEKIVGDTRPEIKEAKANWERFKKAMLSSMKYSKEGNGVEALADYNRVGKKETADLRDRLHKLGEKEYEFAKAMHITTKENNASAVNSMIVTTIICTLVLVTLCLIITKGITDPLKVMVDVCNRLYQRDFRKSAKPEARRDEFGTLLNSLFGMRDELAKFMQETANAADSISKAADRLNEGSTQAAEASTQVAEAVSGVAETVVNQETSVASGKKAVDKVADSVEAINLEAKNVATHTKEASKKALQGREAIEDAVARIQGAETTVRSSAQLVDKLGVRSKEIGTIIDTISGIAAQTNLLALNAAIEAARAGEHGRGFAVVAEEVRKLAEESQIAAQKIAELIQTIQQDTTNAVASMQEGREAVAEGSHSIEGIRSVFEDIRLIVSDVSKRVEAMSDAVATVSKEEDSITKEMDIIAEHGRKVSKDMSVVSSSAEEQSATAEEIAASSDSLAKIAEDQMNALKKFKF